MKELNENIKMEIPVPDKEFPRIPDTDRLEDDHFQEISSLFNDAFKQTGLLEDVQSEFDEANQTDVTDEANNLHSDQLEKGDDGKYYDKETGKSYDSAEEWESKQETLAKRYESTADYYEEKANKEWARFKGSEENGESDAEKWSHYRKSQEYYEKAKECREKAKQIREKIADSHKVQDSDISFTGEYAKRAKIPGRLTTVAVDTSENYGRRDISFMGNHEESFTKWISMEQYMKETKEGKREVKDEPKEQENPPVQTDLSKEKIEPDNNTDNEIIPNEIAERYLDILQERYDNSDVRVRNVLDRYFDKVRINQSSLPSKISPFYNGGLFGLGRGVYYNVNDDVTNVRGAGTTYFHEVGHMIDDVSRPLGGWTSCTREFANALEKDGKNILEAYNNMSSQQKEALCIRISTDDTHSVSDLIEAVTDGKIRGKYGHDSAYWENPANKPIEAFAHFFEASMGRQDKLDNLAGFFPESYKVFQKMIDKLQPKDTTTT